MPHRDQFDACPRCGCALNRYGTRLGCAACGGCLIPATELEELLDQTSPDDVRPLARRLFPATTAPRACPCCAAAMTAHTLYDVTLDRCDVHGVWCDARELAAVLQTNGEAYAARQPVVARGGGTSPWGDRKHRRALAAHRARTTPP